MMDITIYHNPKCSKSRKALDILKNDWGNTINIIEYLNTPLNSSDIEHICKMLNKSPDDIIRKKETTYKELKHDFEHANYAKKCDMIAQKPIILERPVVIANGKAIIARPSELIHTMLN